MAGEAGIGNVGAAIPVAAPDPVAARTGPPLLPLPAASLPLPGTAPGVKTDISTAAQLLSTLLNHPALAGAEAASAGPLLRMAEPDAPVIAAALRNGIALSGLFYESHQAEWIAGARDIAELRREPQARAASDSQAAEATEARLPALVRQQLDMLDGQPLQWRGELWPGMPLQLTLARDREAGDGQDHAAADGAPAEPGWQGRIVSILPALGQVTVRLRISGDRIDLDLASTERAAQDLIASGAAALGHALQSAGLTLASFASRRDEPA